MMFRFLKYIKSQIVVNHMHQYQNSHKVINIFDIYLFYQFKIMESTPNYKELK